MSQQSQNVDDAVCQTFCLSWEINLGTYGKQHQLTFKNNMHIQLSLSLHFYLLMEHMQ